MANQNYGAYSLGVDAKGEGGLVLQSVLGHVEVLELSSIWSL